MSDIAKGQGQFFVQTDITEPFEILTCVGVDDLPLPRGDFTPKYCPDLEHAGKWKVTSMIQGEPALPSTTLHKPYSSVYNFLLEQECAFNGLITHVCEGSRAIPTNFMVGVVAIGMRISGSTLESPVAAEPGNDERVETNADLVYTDRKLVYNLKFARTSVDNTADANGVMFLPLSCGSDCGSDPRALCEVGIMGLDGTQYNSEIKVTLDGSTWAQAAVDPFLYDGGDTGRPVSFDISDGERIVVPRISTAAGEYAEISYTEDRWATKTDVYVGAVAAQTIQRLRKYRGVIWAAASGGYIYKSTDLADTWTAESAGVATAEDLNDIVMDTERVGYAVGNNNAFLYTLDGSTWTAGVGPVPLVNLHTVTVNTEGRVFVGAADGILYASTDDGDTWAIAHNFGAGIVQRAEFDEDTRYFGALIYNTGAPVGKVYRSIDGGATWQAPAGQTTAWNSGLNDIFLCDQNHIVTVGNTHGGTTLVASAVPVS